MVGMTLCHQLVGRPKGKLISTGGGALLNTWKINLRNKSRSGVVILFCHWLFVRAIILPGFVFAGHLTINGFLM